MDNQYNNKVVLSNGSVIIDLTSDTATAADVYSGKTFHSKDGAFVTGSLADGNNTEYGLTDGTSPLVGVGQAGYMVI